MGSIATPGWPAWAQRHIVLGLDLQGGSHILLEVDDRTWLLRRAIFFEWAGNKREFLFSRIRTNAALPAGTFELKVPADCEVIDETGTVKR